MKLIKFDEFVKSPIYSNQLINDKKYYFNYILEPNKNWRLEKKKEIYLLQNTYYNKRHRLIKIEKY